MYARVSILFVSLVMLLGVMSCKESAAERFEREAKEFTKKNCPQHFNDGVTILDSIVFEKKGNGVQKMYYSLQLDDEQRDAFNQSLDLVTEGNLKSLRNNVQFAKLKEAGVSFEYIYHDATTGEKLVSFVYSPTEYE